MPQPEILLPAKEVPLGIRVNLYMPGMTIPEMEEGTPMVFRPLLGGIPQERKIYRIRDETSMTGFERFSLDGFIEGARFSPEATYSPTDAPVGSKYIVFIDNKLVPINGEGSSPLELAKSYHEKFYYRGEFFYWGTFYIANNFPFDSFVPGNEARSFQVSRLDSIPESKLIDEISEIKEILYSCQKDGKLYHLRAHFKSQLEQLESRLDLVAEALARRHWNSPAELIKRFQEANLEDYLRPYSLPKDVKLTKLVMRH